MPWDWWDLTPREFQEQAVGYRWRWRQQQELILSAAILTVTPFTKQPPTVKELLGESDEQRFHAAMGDRQAMVESLDAALEKQQALRAH